MIAKNSEDIERIDLDDFFNQFLFFDVRIERMDRTLNGLRGSLEYSMWENRKYSKDSSRLVGGGFGEYFADNLISFNKTPCDVIKRGSKYLIGYRNAIGSYFVETFRVSNEGIIKNWGVFTGERSKNSGKFLGIPEIEYVTKMGFYEKSKPYCIASLAK